MLKCTEDLPHKKFKCPDGDGLDTRIQTAGGIGGDQKTWIMGLGLTGEVCFRQTMVASSGDGFVRIHT